MTELLFLHWRHLSRAERWCVAILALALVGWLAMPVVVQDQAYHRFADTRSLFGIPNSADVLSNLAFLAVGVYGIGQLAAHDPHAFSPATRAGLWCVSIGFCATAGGSAWYHIAPSDTTLVWDRLPMTVIFAGLIAAALAQRVGENVARVGLALTFELGIASVVYWAVTRDLSLYLLLQFGGLAALLLLLIVTKRGDDPFPWGTLIILYALAKVAELEDQAIWRATGGAFAGHALKHLLAAAVGFAVLLPLARSRRGAPAAKSAAATPAP
jgi:hypothetical protein